MGREPEAGAMFIPEVPGGSWARRLLLAQPFAHAGRPGAAVVAREASLQLISMTRAMPVARCHSMWQWRNHRPGLSATHWTTRSLPAGTFTVSFRGGSVRLSV